MEENRRPARDLGTEHLNITHSDDYQYDEAHDEMPAGPEGQTPARHRVDPPEVNLDAGGDFGYDEAHDFGGS